MKLFYCILLLLITQSCKHHQDNSIIKEPFIIILGTVQDAGSPHIACKKDCCRDLFLQPNKTRKVVCLGLTDPENNKKYLFEASPNITEQLKSLKQFCTTTAETPDGIFLTHAHIGHYTGLMYFGKEAMNANKIPVFAMPLMKIFLENNGPWSQLVSNKNIEIKELEDNIETVLTSNLKVIPFRVPHRDEYSETVGYTIIGPNKKALFIPDINKWEIWDKNIIDEISKVDYAFIDATFYDSNEIPNRKISEIPHPFIIESMALFEKLSIKEKNKIHFIHFNHTNPVLNLKSEQSKKILKRGYNICRVNDIFKL